MCGQLKVTNQLGKCHGGVSSPAEKQSREAGGGLERGPARSGPHAAVPADWAVPPSLREASDRGFEGSPAAIPQLDPCTPHRSTNRTAWPGLRERTAGGLEAGPRSPGQRVWGAAVSTRILLWRTGAWHREGRVAEGGSSGSGAGTGSFPLYSQALSEAILECVGGTLTINSSFRN